MNVIEAAQHLGALLREKEWRLALAESCTGGGLAETITAIPGSSNYFECGFVTYSNYAKTQLLDVPVAILDQFGAVSEETAAAMSEGALQNSRADISISVTGTAGPDGGTLEKPIGTICFGFSKAGSETQTTTQHFNGNRATVRQESVQFALTYALNLL